uniref:Uncharacterized protein n=1 Tax=Cylindrotheca closterium TaxID=2856 RepID=A0A023HAI1_9STRA|nr:hypothetical protein [Cylindrotheca closterium]AGH28660.1 hypothetical protein [Cylindrotheca closterium]
MILTHIKMFFGRSDVKIIIFSTLTGGALQFLSKKYLANHPELLKNSKSKTDIPRGGAIAPSALALGQLILHFLAENGLTTGALSGFGIVISKIPITSLSTAIRKSSVQNMGHLDKYRFVMGDGKIIYIDQCDQNIKYLLEILEDETIPFTEKRELAEKILSKHLNLNTINGRRNFVLCIVFIFYMLSINYNSNFYILMQSLINAIREGKISRAMARLIVRKLKKYGILVDPELVDLVKS